MVGLLMPNSLTLKKVRRRTSRKVTTFALLGDETGAFQSGFQPVGDIVA